MEFKNLPGCRKRGYLMCSHNVHEFDPQTVVEEVL